MSLTPSREPHLPYLPYFSPHLPHHSTLHHTHHTRRACYTTPHSLRFGQVCRGFGLPYELATDTAGFARAYAAALAGRGPSVVEVLTDKEENLRARDALCEAAGAAAQQMLSEMGEIAPEIAPR